MSKRISIITYQCPRCSKSVAGLSRAIHGTDSMRAKYAGLCSSCATEEEKKEILDNQAKSIISGSK